jgi:arylsulfatase A-like enzyme
MHHTLDENVGRILAKLEELGIAGNTVVIFTSDNGGYVNDYRGQRVTSNAPLRSGKGSLYEGGIRVPLIVRWPGVTPKGRVCREPVITTDLYSTICDLIGKPARGGGLEGLSLLPLFKDPTAGLEREALCFHYPHYYPTTSPVSAIRAGNWKLLEYYEDRHVELYNLADDVDVELYNLADDVGESTDLAQKMPGKAAEVRGKLRAWLESVGAQKPRANPEFAK